MACNLTIDLRSFWHPGAGRGGGSVVDAIAHRDSAGLPVLPGRHLKGLLRDALRYAGDLEWKNYPGLAAKLFGDRPEESPGVPQPGCLRVSDATLAPALAAWLASEAGKPLVPHLFRNLYATAVEHESGTANDKSLRGIEVVVPLRLTATIAPIPGREPPADWVERLRGVLPLIGAVGAHRNRGLGRAVLSLEVTA